MTVWTPDKWQKEYLTFINWDSYQLAVLDWLKTSNQSALIEAVAGAGKTSLLEAIVAALPPYNLNNCGQRQQVKISILAFNKHIAEELKSRNKLPRRVNISTAHSCGLSLLRNHFSGFTPHIDKSKISRICEDAIKQIENCYHRHLRGLETYPVKPFKLNFSGFEAQQERREFKYYLIRLVGFCQKTLSNLDDDSLAQLVEHYSLGKLSQQKRYWMFRACRWVMKVAEREAARYQIICFDEMLYLPWKWQLEPSRKDFLLVDEIQDANSAQIALYQSFVRGGARLIGVGDRAQSIYGFAGSEPQAWQAIKQAISVVELPLSICHRCPKLVIKRAKQIVPQIEASPQASNGIVKEIERADLVSLLTNNDLILCRFNAPLVGLCLQLLSRGFSARVRGKDIGKQLIDFAHEFMQYFSDFPQIWYNRFSQSCRDKIHQLSEQGNIVEATDLQDKFQALKYCYDRFVGIMRVTSFEEFTSSIAELFNDERSSVLLSTIHRAKGSEAERVFLLKYNLLPYINKVEQDWQRQQEINLLYVALTRTKQELYLVIEPEQDEEESEE